MLGLGLSLTQVAVRGGASTRIVGPQILISNRFQDENTAIGTTIGTFTVVGGTGTYTFTKTADPSSAFTLTSGVLKNAIVFDYETTTSYSLTVNANNGAGSSINRTLTIGVNDVDDVPPVILTSATQTVAENAAFSLVMTADKPATWARIGGADAGLFVMTGDTLTMTAKNFEAPADANADNAYVVQVMATSAAGFSSNKTITVTVTDVVNPTITSSATPTVAENTAFAMTLTASEAVTWAKVGGADTTLFTLTGATLAMTAKDFEIPVDADANNTYVVQVQATSTATGEMSAPQTITVSVTDVADVAPVITTPATASIAENVKLAIALTADQTVTWSLNGGADVAKVEISGMTLRWLSDGTKNFEAPDDADANNAYVVTVRATNGAGATTDKTITVTVTDVDETIGAIGTPALLWISNTETSPPVFSYTVPTDPDLTVGDNVHIQRATVSDFSTGVTDYNNTIDATEDAANALTFSSGTWANGTWYVRGCTERGGAATNLILQSETLNVSPWTFGASGGTISANAASSPTGTTTAEMVTDSATSNIFGPAQTLAVVNATTYTVSVHAKAGTLSWLQIYLGTGKYANFNLSSGVTGSVAAGATAQITAAGSGWYRCSLTYTVAGSSETVYLLLEPSNTVGVPIYAGSGSGTFYLWGAQFEQGILATSYIPTTTSTVSGVRSAWSNTETKTLAVGVAPTITTGSTASVSDNAPLAIALTADQSVTWSFNGGADVAKFEISGTTLRWLSNGVKDFEAPDDVGADNTYIAIVRATNSSSITTDKTITVTVTAGAATTTWDPATVGAGATLSNGNLDFGPAGATYTSVRTVVGKSTGKWVFEVSIITIVDHVGFGICDNTTPGAMSTYVGNIPNSGMAFNDGNNYVNGMTNAHSVTLNETAGKIYTIAFDADAKKAWLAENNVWLSGDPAAGTTPYLTWTAAYTIFGAVTIYGSADKVRFDQTLTYPLPSGFTQLG